MSDDPVAHPREQNAANLAEQLRRSQALVGKLQTDLRRESAARRSRRELATIAAGATSAASALEVARALAEGSGEAVGGAVCLVALPDGDTVHLVHGPTMPEGVRADWQDVPWDTAVPIVAALTGRSGWIELMDLEAIADWPLLRQEAGRAGIEAFVAIPLRPEGHDDALGVLGVGFASAGSLGEFERSLLAELCDVGTSALERIEELEGARSTIETLQRSLLPPRLVPLAGLEVIAYYEPGAERARVGGDWYDQVCLPDGSVAFVIGDVAGHDLAAAATMGQVRHVLASQLLARSDPSDALNGTDRYFSAVEASVLATALVAVLSPDRSELRYATAGHPSALVRSASGVRSLPVVPGAPLGTGFGIPTSASVPFAPDDVLVMFTDGLVERRAVPLDAGIAALARRIGEELSVAEGRERSITSAVAAAAGTAPTALVNDDDTAVLVIGRSGPRSGP